jgi:RimJ/RimL family protein N-acetyltransferase
MAGDADTLPERIESERLVIRVARPGDGARFNAAVVASHAQLAPWLAWVSPPPTPAQSEAACRRAYARWLLNEDLMALFLLKDGGALVGGSGLHRVDWTLRHFEVGYWGHHVHAGRGLVAEGVRALAEHALDVLRANRVHLTTDDRNVASWRLAERAGFVFEGKLRNERLDLQGRLRDTRVYARTPERGQRDGSGAAADATVAP